MSLWVNDEGLHYTYNGTSWVSDLTGRINVQTGTSYTMAASDLGKIVECNNASAVTVTLPNSLLIGLARPIREATGRAAPDDTAGRDELRARGAGRRGLGGLGGGRHQGGSRPGEHGGQDGAELEQLRATHSEISPEWSGRCQPGVGKS